jgi:hypothetical protein
MVLITDLNRTILRSFPRINNSFLAEDEVLRNRILSLPVPTSDDTLPSTVKNDLIELLRHPEVQAKVDRCEHAQHFLDSMDRIITSEYVPTEEDIFRVHVCQSSVYDTTLSANYRLYRFWDVGTQPRWKPKWFPVVEGVEAVVFAVSLASYDELWDPSDNHHNMLRGVNIRTSLARQPTHLSIIISRHRRVGITWSRECTEGYSFCAFVFTAIVFLSLTVACRS